MSGVVVLIDATGGNLHSAETALRRLGAAVAVTSDPAAVAAAGRIVLPGDGAFPACRAALDAVPGLLAALEEARRRGTPILGICAGMQLLADRGEEHGGAPGLGWVPGVVTALAPADPALRVPHMGWNDLTLRRLDHPLLAGVRSGDHAYFVHSWQFVAQDAAHVLATADHGGPVAAMVARGNVAGCQFHPEKSQAAGLAILRNFLGWRP